MKSQMAASHPNIAPLVLVEQIRTQYDSMPTSFLGSVFSSSLYVAVAHTVIPAWQWGTWLVLMLLQAAVRGWLWLEFRKKKPEIGDMPRWGRLAACGSAFSGIIWGLGALLVFPSNHIEYQLFYMFLVACMGSLSAIASASFLPAFYAYTYPTVIPISILLLFQPDDLLRTMGVISLGYLPVISKFAHNLGKAMTESFQLRFENRELLREVTLRKEQAEDASREKSMFLANASHDLRQPLHALTLQAHLLKQTSLSKDQQPLVSALNTSISAMTQLFEALLDISRLDAGVVRTEVINMPLQPQLDRLKLAFEPLANAKGLRLVVRPSTDTVLCDSALFQSLADNLVSNAIRYSTRGGVLVACRRRGKKITFEVWDTGIGITESEQVNIYKPFYQVGNSQRDRNNGLGLGLAIVEQTTKLLHLAHSMQSRPGRGTVFRVELPLGTAYCTEPTPAETPLPACTLHGLQAVVIDDEDDVRSSSCALLESWGCVVYSAGSIDEVLKRTAHLNAAPDILICDYRLENGVTGMDAIARLRDEFNAPIPALLITGDTETKLLHDMVGDHVDVMHKPVNPTQLNRYLLKKVASYHVISGNSDIEPSEK